MISNCSKCGKELRTAGGLAMHVKHCKGNVIKALEATSPPANVAVTMDPVKLIESLNASTIRTKITELDAQRSALAQLLKVAEARKAVGEIASPIGQREKEDQEHTLAYGR